MWIYVLNENGKVQEETPDRFKFRCYEKNIETLRYVKMTLPLFDTFSNLKLNAFIITGFICNY